MKDMMIDIEAERFNEWLEENYPDIVPESEAWEEAANLYYWEQEALADQAQWDHEHGLFVVSLNDVHQRQQARKTGAAEATCPARQRAARTGVQDVFRPCSDCHGSIPDVLRQGSAGT